MMLTLMTALAVMTAAQSPDTTVDVRRGQRLAVSVHAGAVEVRTWNRDAVQVRATGGSDAELDVRRRGERVTVDASGSHGEPVTATLTVHAPSWMPVTVGGVDLDITVDGIAAPLSLETVQGDVTVRGGAELVTLTSVEGSVSLRGARGRMQVSSVNDDVEVIDAQGDLAATTVNGDVQLSGIQSDNVDASTINGDIAFSGPIRNAGRYRFSSHNGDLTVTFPENTSAVVNVATFSGDFEAGFPVTVTGMRRGQRFSFTIGSGSAHVELESFQGDIRLVRPGAANPAR
ncbi:MAG: DUF4097 domain-containing protein [Gemmatimonadota bacterium]|nr:DUF4097 domain-containing protein [Gemmatimonadota bacterium]